MVYCLLDIMCDCISQQGLWAHFINNGSMENMLEYHHCPPGYCQCSKVDDNSEACTSVYYYNDEDDQCVCDREGSEHTG